MKRLLWLTSIATAQLTFNVTIASAEDGGRAYAASSLANAVLASELATDANTLERTRLPVDKLTGYRNHLDQVQERLEAIELSNSVLELNNKLVGKLLGAAGGGKSPYTKLVGSGMNILFKWTETVAQERLDRNRTELYAGLFARAELNDSALFKSTVGSKITKDNYQIARSFVEGVAGPLARQALGERPQDKDVLIQHELDIINDGLMRAAALQLANKDEIDQRITASEKDISDLQKNVGEFKASVAKEINDLKEAQRALSDVTELIAGETEKNSADIAFIQDMMFGKMSAAEQRIAVESGGFFRNMDPEKRERLLDRIATMERVEKAQTFLTGAQHLAALAGHLGLPQDQIQNFQSNVSVAQSAVTVVGALATNQWMSALAASSGLFGGGGDGTATSLAFISEQRVQIRKELRELRAISLEVLTEVRQLREEMLTAFQKVDDRFVQLQTLTLRDRLAGLASCHSFVLTMGSSNGSSGIFATYENRREHFKLRGADYDSCLASLHNVLQTQAPSFDAIFQSANLGGSVSGKALETKHYKATLLATLDHLGAGRLTDREGTDCVEKALSTFMLYDSRGSDGSKLNCWVLKESKIAPYTVSSHQPSEAYAMLGRELYVPFLLTIGRDLLALAPYRDFVTVGADGLSRMKTTDELQHEGLRGTKVDLAVLMGTHLDVVNAAIAQQAMLSGGAITQDVTETLSDSKFGFANEYLAVEVASGLSFSKAIDELLNIERVQRDMFRREPINLLAELADCRAGGKECERRKGTCEFAERMVLNLCLVGSSFDLRRNIGQLLAARIVAKTGRLQYAAVLASGQPEFMKQLMLNAGLTAEVRGEPHFVITPKGTTRYPAWSIEVETPAGIVQVPLPSPYEASTTRTSMSPEWHELIKLRDQLRGRLFLLTVDTAIEKATGSAADRQFVRDIGLQDPSLALVN